MDVLANTDILLLNALGHVDALVGKLPRRARREIEVENHPTALRSQRKDDEAYKLRNGLYRQNVTVYNVGSQPIPQPLALLVGHLGRKVRLTNAFGTTRSIMPGTPYVLGSASNAQLNSFQGASFTLFYKNPQNKKIKPLFELVAGITNP